MTTKQDLRRARMTTAHKIKGSYKSFADALHVSTRLVQFTTRCQQVRDDYNFVGDNLEYERAQQKQALFALLDLRRSLLA